ncbi:MAG: glycosyltransferase family 2 protein [Flavobacteriales bacterium]
MTFFSVVIPTFNRSQLASRAIESVFNQTFSDFEVILVDDGSTDDTKEVLLEKFSKDPRFKYIYQTNAKESAARNNGVMQSTGRFVCFLDSDDYYLSDHLAKLHERIKENGEALAFYHTLSYVEHENGERKKLQEEHQVESNPFYYLFRNQILPINICIPREVAIKYPFRVDIYNDEDSEMFYRVVSDFPIVAIPEHTVVYFQHQGNSRDFYNKSSTYYLNRIQSTDIYLSNERIKSGFPERFFETKKARNLEWAAVAALREGKKKEAIAYMKQSESLLGKGAWSLKLLRFYFKALLS